MLCLSSPIQGMCASPCSIKLKASRRCAPMLPDQRLQRVESLRLRIRVGLAHLRAAEWQSQEWERILAQLEPLWGDLFCLLEEMQLS